MKIPVFLLSLELDKSVPYCSPHSPCTKLNLVSVLVPSIYFPGKSGVFRVFQTKRIPLQNSLQKIEVCFLPGLNHTCHQNNSFFSFPSFLHQFLKYELPSQCLGDRAIPPLPQATRKSDLNPTFNSVTCRKSPLLLTENTPCFPHVFSVARHRKHRPKQPRGT